MRYIALDTETALALKGLQAPPLACLSWAEERYGHIESGVVSRYDALPLFESWLEDPTITLVGHNVAFDTVVCMNARESRSAPPHWGLGPSELTDTVDIRFRQLIFNKYEQGLVQDTMLRERLRELAQGTIDRPKGWYTLGALAKKYFDMDLDKSDESWRLGYGKLIPIPFSEWPEAALKYADEDAVATLRLFHHQGDVVDGEAQARTGLAFQLMRTWGIRTDPLEVQKLEERLKFAYNEYAKQLKDHGILRYVGQKLQQDMSLTRMLVEQTYPGKVPLTDKGAVRTANEVVEKCSHPALQHLAEFKDIQKTLKTFLPVVQRGTEEPICPRINVIKKNGRCSFQAPNLQNLPRRGGVRECFVPRAGKVFVDFDFDTLEIRTLAEILLHRVNGRTLVDAYARDPGFDPHTRLASQIMGITYEQGIALKKQGDSQLKDMRQMSKAGNFGYPGGMGPRKFVDYAWKSYQVSLTVDESYQLRRSWMRSLPEIDAYFEQCSAATRDRAGVIEQLYSGRVRGGMSFTDMANGWWSGLAADGSKWGLWNVAKACYALPESPLFGARMVVYVHDEYILEGDEERGHEMGMELQRIATESMRKYTPNVPSSGESQLMKRWWKNAEPVFDAQGRLKVWEPKEVTT